MGKGRPRAVEKSVLGQTSIVSSPGALSLPQAPVFYPTEEEFRDPLEFIDKIRAEAEPFGVCKIVPPKSWKPPFALDVDEFTFPTKTQAIHQLQVRFAACNTETFELEYNRFLEDHCGKKVGKRVRVLFEGDDLDLCKLFNAVKRFGGYDKVVKEKKWGEVFRFLRSVGKSGPITECSKHVLSQLYREHLFDFESYNSRLNCDQSAKKSKRGSRGSEDTDVLSSKKRWNGGEKVNVDKLQEKEEFDQICEQCKSGLHGEVMLLCDKCNKGWHIYCLSPPLKQIPSGNWYCLECVNSEKDSFGFVPGKHFSIETFRRLADKAKRKWFGSSTCAVSRPQIEKLFWEIVEGSVGEVEVMYGSDLDTSLYGSGFPRVSDPRPSSIEVESWNEYCASPWNLNNLPKLQGSMLRTVHDNIEGVMVPWLYMGMLFSSFCWHFEDHCFYSMNYLHWGEPKCWYSVPGSEAHVFEQAMKSSLPDLFDAQPDLLFQLVTMLNPSVLQDNGVPVYTVLQEPGNFVITFPRSYHGGFNLGLNCAEAVNFAPADWLPHGGFGAELYRLYHKPAVLSHEELLCVVAKNECNEKVTPYLRKELIKLFAKEKDWRERLWRNGIVRSSPMSPRKYPEYVGTEEDPTCIICQQYLYLSAVACNCSPSAFVCLEHWEHLCECKSKKQRLLYRHTLAELNSLVLTVDACNLEETAQGRSCRRQYSCSKDTNAATKKVKGGRATHAQLAEEWILSSFNIFLNEFSDAAYVDALKEAEQFLWAGSEMDPVRDMAKNLIEAKKWALNVRSCLSKIETWLLSCDNNTEKVNLGDLESLLNVEPLPCNEPGHVKLKVCADEARRVANEITTALSTFSYVSMDVFEELYSRASGLPTYVQECKKLGSQIALEKAWLVSARNCISANSCTAVDIDILHTLKLEISELQVQVPEMKMLSDLLQNAESWQVRCREMLGSTIKLKELVVILEDAYDFTVSFPELKLLRQYHCDAVTWTFRFHDILLNIEEREDQHNVVMELTCILKDGASLRVQVDELPLVEVELRKACCRDKALKARATPMPLDYIKQLISDAARLCIENEKLFIGTSAILATAISWEERAQQVLAAEAKISDFENVLRVSEHIVMALPSLDDLKNTLSMAKSWIVKCQPFLESVLSSESASRSLLRVDALKVLLAEAKLLKVTLEEPEMLQSILKVCEAWQGDACALLDRADSLLAANDISWDLIEDISTKVEELFTAIKCSTKVGLSLGFDFCEISKLQKASCRLFWCSKSLSFCSSVPVLEEVEDLIKEAEHMSVASNLERLLIDGISWLKNALEVFSERLVRKRCKLAGVEEILVDAQVFSLRTFVLHRIYFKIKEIPLE
ncbi:hypothetical protein GIB67_008337 [Kingdonia uniflora]|uniref:Uncharacterized protein n=1 Tax=Kingdonia uniflora TaxID=39325 RepID=A0A7J7N5L8_9MAGN|nr:hypothetical protein GIB67_008337 [Kingdonia uniflora]